MVEPPAPWGAERQMIGTSIGRRYRIEAMLGSGGMGAVFRAFDTSAGRDVAIKVLHPTLVANIEAVARFRRESLALSRLLHPNCVRVTDVGQTRDRLPFMVMELIEGAPLSGMLGVRMSVMRAVELARQVLAGLAHAHACQIVHRDIKPDNILVTEGADGLDEIKLVDFGIARLGGDACDADVFSTQLGDVFGTPQYMSPEQASGGQADHRADLYATGLVLYEILAGHPAVQGRGALDALRRQVTEQPAPLPPDIPESVQRFVARLLMKQPDARFGSAAEATSVITAIGDELERSGWRRGPRRRTSTLRSPGPTTEKVTLDSPPNTEVALAPPSGCETLVAVSESEAAPESVDPPPRRGRITQLSGIDLDRLQLEPIDGDEG